ncbi:sodium/calcium exchanger 3 isoform X1 [Vanessa atalanta]|uniref:sodium/calcium exchanger 3 isoform X1 n=1 Tax=Vanessa atalanta TaxID=42275 RepID=UPI001FCD9B33|nr:sodium/calcium exchanger 3 isoform X1 [Vanessa atalanta]
MRPALAALAACCVVARAELPSARLASRNTTTQHVLQCSEGLVLPLWLPLEDVPTLQIALRGFVYFFTLMYLFIGVSIVSDRFMAAIEVITSREKEVRVRRNGSEQIIVVRVWNETVANLTLMALGSSAPEILLSVIEIAGKNFEAGDLGPGTIVGSAAYNLFVIIAICVMVIPDGEVRKIKHLRVFLVTATWSIFAYVWLYLILAVISPSEVEVWEGAVTFLFFPATVMTAYIADRRLLVYKYLKKGYRVNERGVIVEGEGDGSVEMALKPNSDEFASDDEEGRELDKSRKEYISVLRELRRQHPEEDLETVERMALETLMARGPKSRAFYRVAATRKMTGGGDFSRKISERAQSDLSEVKAELQRRESTSVAVEPKGPNLRFDPDHYTVMENCGSFEVRVIRRGDLSGEVTVQYNTEDGTAEAGSDYVAAQGSLVFGHGETEKKFTVQVIDDDVFEEDEHFYVRLTAPKGACLASPSTATVVILDDDHSGVFSFPQRDFELTESVGTYELRVVRTAGARGKVRIPYWTEDGTAKSGAQFEAVQDSIVFEDNETEKFISLHIIEEDSYEKDVLFYVNLGNPVLLGDDNRPVLTDNEVEHLTTLPEEEAVVALMGYPRAGEITRAQLRVKESKEFKNTVDKLVQRANASIIIGTSSWKEQFSEALTASSDNPDEQPSCGDYILHIFTLFWKIIFAFVPPTDIGGGYVCFVVSIICIGLVTAVIGDVASHFGCTLGIKDSVTAIIFVALGTSIPDTFASKVAAIQDKHADASVGNVTGSNAVNVFLGIGVAWTVAAVVHWSKNEKFVVDPGNLAFSVTMFCSEAALAVLVLVLRRRKSIGGELGGPRGIKIVTSMFFFSLWLIYLTMSTLEAYGFIEGF